MLLQISLNDISVAVNVEVRDDYFKHAISNIYFDYKMIGCIE